MISLVQWKIRICDICSKDESLLQSRIVGLMENGDWVDGYSKEKSDKVSALRGEWEREITKPCLVFDADMDEVVICEDHLLELLAKKNEQIESQTHVA
jgi:hypothetical protein